MQVVQVVEEGFKLLDLFTMEEQQVHELRIQFGIEDVQNGFLDHVGQPGLIAASECDCPLEAASRVRHNGCVLLASRSAPLSGNLLLEKNAYRPLGQFGLETRSAT